MSLPFSSESHQRPRTILIVEDGAAQAVRMSSTLREAGFATELAPDGSSALLAFKRHHPDLVLLDVHLPDMDGREVAQQLRALPLGSGTPILFMTAVFCDVGDMIRGLNDGGDDYLLKPVEDDALIARVNACLRAKRTHLELTQLARQLLTVSTISREIASCVDKTDVLARVIDQVRSSLSYDHVSVLLAHGETYGVAASSRSGLNGQSLDPAGNTGLGTAALRLGRPVLGTEAASASYTTLVPDAPHGVAVPFYSHDGVSGALEINTQGALQLGDRDLTVLRTLADMIGIALYNARIYQSVLHRATYDELTGVLNRRAALEELENEFRRAHRYGRALGVVFLDIDQFKSINDTHGHGVGDEALRVTAGVLRKTLRREDKLGRIGGDEFIGVLPETALGATAAVAERLRTECELVSIKSATGEPVRLTISIGYSGWPDAHAASATELLGQADSAMFRAKGCGRNATSM